MIINHNASSGQKIHLNISPPGRETLSGNEPVHNAITARIKRGNPNHLMTSQIVTKVNTNSIFITILLSLQSRFSDSFPCSQPIPIL